MVHMIWDFMRVYILFCIGLLYDYQKVYKVKMAVIFEKELTKWKQL